MKKKKIYIAGKVTNEPIAECTMKFGKAQKQIEDLGFEAVNPLAVVGGFNVSWQKAMRSCIARLMYCEALVLLPDWKLSNGARIERQLADDLDIPIFNYDDFGLKVLKARLCNSPQPTP